MIAATRVAAACLTLLLALEPASAQATGVGDPDADSRRIAELIEQLSDPRYAVRADAQRRLRDEGLRAFDPLHAALDSPDAETAAVAERLLSELTIHWSWRGDPPSVREHLAAYADYDTQERVETIRALRQLSNHRGIDALVRIARFDLAPRVSREAARAVVALASLGEESAADAARETVARLDRLYGPSSREASRWLRLALEEGVADRAARWRRFADREARLLEQRPGDTTPEIVVTLIWSQLLASLGSDDLDLGLEAIDRLTEVQPDQASRRLELALLTLSERERWPLVDRVLDCHADALETKRGLYLQARIASARGEESLADRLAERAHQAGVERFSVGPNRRGPALDARLSLAAQLRSDGHAAWARRELADVGEQLDPMTLSAVAARWNLSELQHDAGLYAEASETLAGLDGAIHASKQSLRAYGNLLNNSNGMLRPAEMVTSRRWFYRALAAAEAGESRDQTEALRQAVKADPSDADVLIAMHRVENPSPDFAAETRRRIDQLCLRFESRINNKPHDDESLNGWAWLVGNTYGDFEKAVRYSRRSLELRPDTAGYLDTLGRSLFAAGRIDEAIETQRRAVRLAPNTEVMQRQLEEFERARGEASAEDPS